MPTGNEVWGRETASNMYVWWEGLLFSFLWRSVFRPAGADTTNQSQFRTLRKSIILIINNLRNRITQWLHSITAKQTISVLWKCQLQRLLWDLSLMRFKQIAIPVEYSSPQVSCSLHHPSVRLRRGQRTRGGEGDPWGGDHGELHWELRGGEGWSANTVW